METDEIVRFGNVDSQGPSAILLEVAVVKALFGSIRGHDCHTRSLDVRETRAEPEARVVCIYCHAPSFGEMLLIACRAAATMVRLDGVIMGPE